MKKRNVRKDKFVLNVTRKDYQAEIAAGMSPEDAMRPGKHLFRRVDPNRVASPEDLRTRKIKLIVTLRLDKDVVEFFKARARDQRESSGYQTQINAELRKIVEASKKDLDTVRALRQAQGLIETVVKQQVQGKTPKGQAAPRR
jgi:uncharacterized protein (DUF4415 family)